MGVEGEGWERVWSGVGQDKGQAIPSYSLAVYVSWVFTVLVAHPSCAHTYIVKSYHLYVP